MAAPLVRYGVARTPRGPRGSWRGGRARGGQEGKMTMLNPGTPDLPARRRDEFSDWHDLVPESCDGCGCTYFFAKDDPAIVWEPESAWDEGCPTGSAIATPRPSLGNA